MKGESLTRLKPDPQDGGGFVQELLKVKLEVKTSFRCFVRAF